jgi:hypothetical protein
MSSVAWAAPSRVESWQTQVSEWGVGGGGGAGACVVRATCCCGRAITELGVAPSWRAGQDAVACVCHGSFWVRCHQAVAIALLAPCSQTALLLLLRSSSGR